MPTEQSSPSCTLRPSAAKWSSRTALAVYRDGFHYRFTQLKRIWYDTSCHRSPDQNEPFHTMPKGSRRTAICNTLHATYCTTTRYPKKDHHRQRKSVHLRIMEGNHKEFRDWEKIKHSFPPGNGRSDRKNEFWNNTCDHTSIINKKIGAIS